MAAREKIEEAHHSGCRLHDNGVDGVLNNDYKDNCAKDLGPI